MILYQFVIHFCLFFVCFKVQSSCLFNLLLSLETPSPDPLNIGELVKEEKPLRAIDFCYHDDNEMVNVLDCISLCVMVVAYAADSVRGHQMLVLPIFYLKLLAKLLQLINILANKYLRETLSQDFFRNFQSTIIGSISLWEARILDLLLGRELMLLT